MQCVAWCDMYFNFKHKDLLVKQTNSKGETRLVAPLVHTKNEKKRTPQAGKRDKLKGVRAGYPDLVLHVMAVAPNRFIPSPCLAIELKSEVGKLSINQQHWREYLEAIGAAFVVCRTLKEFQRAVEEYMG